MKSRGEVDLEGKCVPRRDWINGFHPTRGRQALPRCALALNHPSTSRSPRWTPVRLSTSIFTRFFSPELQSPPRRAAVSILYLLYTVPEPWSVPSSQAFPHATFTRYHANQNSSYRPTNFAPSKSLSVSRQSTLALVTPIRLPGNGKQTSTAILTAASLATHLNSPTCLLRSTSLQRSSAPSCSAR